VTDREPEASGGDQSALDSRLAALSPDKRALLQQRLIEQRAGVDVKGPPLVRRTDNGPAALSFSQELMWLLQQLAPESPVYNSTGAHRLQGPLDVAVIQATLDAFIDRHEILRTRVEVVADTPVQVVADSASAPLRTLDISALGGEAQEAELESLITDEVRRPFDLEHDLPLRATLIRLGAEEHVLVLVVHHFAWDGWSRGVAYRELSALYRAFLERKPVPLSPVELQYSDFAVWQRRGSAVDSRTAHRSSPAGGPERERSAALTVDAT
jgi:hypothetical protein